MRVTRITCDNCSGPIPNDRSVVAVLGHEWCSNCADFSATHDLIGIPFASWPLLVRRADLRRWLEWRDRRSPNIEQELRSLRDRLAARERELEQLRAKAADGYANGDLAVALSDIASNANRRSAVTA